jgi:hypothetical protein
MKIIPNSQALIGMLEGGELNEDLTEKLDETLAELHSISEDQPKKVHKGSLTLKLDFSVANGMVTISSDITTKTPRKVRRSSAYWVTEGGKLSTEHPQQHDMFSGPRGVTERA